MLPSLLKQKLTHFLSCHVSIKKLPVRPVSCCHYSHAICQNYNANILPPYGLSITHEYSTHNSDEQLLYVAPRSMTDLSRFFFREAVIWSCSSLVLAYILGVYMHYPYYAAAVATIPCISTGIGQYWSGAVTLAINYNCATNELVVHAPGQLQKLRTYKLLLTDIKTCSMSVMGSLIYIKIIGTKGQRLQMLVHPSAFNNSIMKETFLTDMKQRSSLLVQQKTRIQYLTLKLQTYFWLFKNVKQLPVLKSLPLLTTWLAEKKGKVKYEIDILQQIVDFIEEH